MEKTDSVVGRKGYGTGQASRNSGDAKKYDAKIVLRKLSWLCSRREYCSGDILKKIRNYGIEGKEAVSILKFLQDGGYVDDSRYASAYVRDKTLIAGWGTRKIIYALKAKGVSPELIEAAVDEVVSDEDTSRKMRTVVEKKWLSLKKEEHRARVAKTLRYALGRGYDYEEVMAEINGIMKKSEE